MERLFVKLSLEGYQTAAKGLVRPGDLGRWSQRISYRTWLDGTLPSSGPPAVADRVEEVEYSDGKKETCIAGTLVKN